MTNQTDERDIIRGLKNGHEEAYKYVFENYYTLMCHTADTILKDEATSKAVSSDVISHIWEIRENIDIHTSLRSFLLRSVYNAAINHVKSAAERHITTFSSLKGNEKAVPIEGKENTHPLRLLEQSELEEAIEKAVNALPENTRKIFSQSRFENKTYKEIAENMGVSVNDIKYHMKRSITLLRESLSQYLTTIIICLLLL